MRASTLQRQVYRFLIVIGPHPGERPITRVMTARLSSTCAPAIASLLDQLVVTNRVGRGRYLCPGIAYPGAAISEAERPSNGGVMAAGPEIVFKPTHLFSNATRMLITQGLPIGGTIHVGSSRTRRT